MLLCIVIIFTGCPGKGYLMPPIVALFLLLFTPALIAQAAKPTINIAVLKSVTVNAEQLKPSFHYLEQKYPEYDFVFHVMEKHPLNKGLALGKIDFLITSSGHYVTLQQLHQTQYPLLSMYRRYPNGYAAQFGIVFFSLKTNPIPSSHLQDASLVTLEPQIAMDHSIALKELHAHDLNPHELKIITTTDANELVNMVLQKTIQIGILNTYQYAQLSPQIQNQLHILFRHTGWKQPFSYSSSLYPDWYFAASWKTPQRLITQISIALLEYSLHHQQADILWKLPESYQKVKNLYQYLRLPPFDQPLYQQHILYTDLLKTFWVWFVIATLIVLILALSISYIMKLNRRLSVSKKALETEIHERKLAQETALQHQADLAHVARLSTMGEMAAGLAHELNQPLSAIVSYVQGCARRIRGNHGKTEDLLQALELAAEQANRAGKIIQRLRSFVKKGESRHTYTEINHIVNEVLAFLDDRLKKQSVQLELQLTEHLPPIFADIIQIEQVLINLIKNAIDAMQDNENKYLFIRTQLYEDENFIELQVKDSGKGMDQEQLKTIFHPFVTTKQKGLGMGLSISSSILEAHGGRLKASSELGKGACFSLILPIARGKTHHEQ